MVEVRYGAVKYSSLKAAYEAAKKRNPDLKYMTFYMRQRAAEKAGGLGMTIGQAMARKPRKYNKVA